jgi:hypothetical protein
MRIAALAAALTLLAASCSRDVIVSDDYVGGPPTIIGCDTYSFGATIDRTMWTWEVPYTEVAKTPDWRPGTEPPLPVSQAISLAEQELPKYTNTPAAFQLERVEYFHVGNQMSDPTKWFYLVSFERLHSFGEQTFQSRGTITIPVLLDGTVIQGKSAPFAGAS